MARRGSRRSPFAARMDTLMKERGWSNERLAEALGVERGNVGHWRTGRHEPGWEMVQQMAELFEVNDYWLLTGRRYPRRILPSLTEFLVAWQEGVIAGEPPEEVAAKLLGYDLPEEDAELLRRLGPTVQAAFRSGDGAAWGRLSDKDWRLVEELVERLSQGPRSNNLRPVAEAP